MLQNYHVCVLGSNITAIVFIVFKSQTLVVCLHKMYIKSSFMDAGYITTLSQAQVGVHSVENVAATCIRTYHAIRHAVIIYPTKYYKSPAIPNNQTLKNPHYLNAEEKDFSPIRSFWKKKCTKSMFRQVRNHQIRLCIYVVSSDLPVSAETIQYTIDFCIDI